MEANTHKCPYCTWTCPIGDFVAAENHYFRYHSVREPKLCDYEESDRDE